VSIPPEFAVDVVSPTDLASDVQQKAEDYIRAGVDLVWVVFPRTGSVQILRGDGRTAVVRAGETSRAKTRFRGSRFRSTNSSPT
jgi:Uma2 family endonuclease